MADYFLNIENSVSGKCWLNNEAATKTTALAICQTYGIPEIIGRILAARNVPHNEVDNYLNPTIKSLMPDPYSLRDMDKAAQRLATAIKNSECIGILGDYDVDGATSTSILVLFCRAIGIDIDFYIPNRITEGYGPSDKAYNYFASKDINLIITVDCGIMAFEPIKYGNQLGIDTIIIDHHQADNQLPNAHAIVNPKRNDDLSGLDYLAAVGVTFLLIVAVNRYLRENNWYNSNIKEPDIIGLLDIVAMGTICDMVPLVGLNRAYVTQGLKIMGTRSNIGLRALSDISRINKKPDPYTVGFMLGPRINAAGRLGYSDLGTKLLSANNFSEAMDIAHKLEQYNIQRKNIELDVLAQAMQQTEKQINNDSTIIIVAGDNWHPGVLGIVAGRIKDKILRPVITISFNDNNIGTASGRSIPGIDLGKLIAKACKNNILVKGGGHSMAAGLTIAREQLEKFKEFANSEIKFSNINVEEIRSLIIDGAVSARGITEELFTQIQNAGPYGIGNPEPKFAIPSVYVAYADVVGDDHIKCKFKALDGTIVDAIAFRSLGSELGEVLLTERQRALHIVGRLSINEWGGKRKAQLLLDDIAFT